MESIEAYATAGKSVIETLRDRDLGSGFRKACIASIDYLKQTSTNGKPLDVNERKIINKVLKLGTLINDYYDLGNLQNDEYVELRRDFQKLQPDRENDFKKYRRMLSDYEKRRPSPGELIDDNERERRIVKYRENVNELSLAFVFSVALQKPMEEFLNPETRSKYAFFDPFLKLTMAIQVVDDSVGAQGDLKHNRPSFYTAVCSNEELIERNLNDDKTTNGKMAKYFDNYLKQAKSQKLTYMKPLILAVKATQQIYPKLVNTVHNGSFPSVIGGLKLVTQRDSNNL